MTRASSSGLLQPPLAASVVPTANAAGALSGASRPVPAWLLVTGVFLLFLIWSNSFIAIEYLLIAPASDAAAAAGQAGHTARFDWVSLTVARFVPVTLFCAVWCFGFQRRAAIRVVREHWRRLILGGLFAVCGYNLALYYGQQHRVASPVASMMTATTPLYLMILGALFLGEPITRKRVLGFAVALVGVVTIATSRDMGGGSTYPLMIAIVAAASLCWASFSALSKPVSGKVPPLLWTFLALIFGGAPLLFVLPFRGWTEMTRLDGWGWSSLLFLSVFSTLVAFAMWAWLLRHLPASTVGLTVFLNPPMTTASKFLLATMLPAAFSFTVTGGELLGGAITLVGVGIAILRRRRPDRSAFR